MGAWRAIRAAACAAVFALVPLHAANADRVLATAGGHELTTAMTEAGITFGEFLAGTVFTEAEAQALTKEAIRDFQADPADEIDGYRQAQALLGRVASMDTAAERAAERTRVTTLLYWAFQDDDVPSLLQVVYRYAPVIAADPQSELVVTRRAVDALVDSNGFVAELAGFEPMTQEETAHFLERLPAAFAEMPAERQALAAHAEARWETLRARWAALSEEEREAAVRTIREVVESRDMVPSAARELEAAAQRLLANENAGAALRDFFDTSAMSILPSIMLQQNATFN